MATSNGYESLSMAKLTSLVDLDTSIVNASDETMLVETAIEVVSGCAGVLAILGSEATAVGYALLFRAAYLLGYKRGQAAGLTLVVAPEADTGICEN